jgi:ferredoxin--NADP+ reductase
MQNLTKIKITSIQQPSKNAYIIGFAKTENFLPGQIIGITTNPALAPRLYSLCSAPNQIEMAVLFTLKTDGKLTPNLATKKPGDSIWVTAVQGKFIYTNEPAWWIATGTGIAPFNAMFLSGQKPLKLIQGGRTQQELFFRDNFENHSDYIKCCSQDHGIGIYSGRLTHYMQSLNNIPSHINYYLCGSAEMVVDVRNILIAKGVSFKNIITEIYF